MSKEVGESGRSFRENRETKVSSSFKSVMGTDPWKVVVGEWPIEKLRVSVD